jgi:hypothetical protein
MALSTAELTRIVLEAVSEDYESFESVVLKLSRLDHPVDDEYDLDQIERSLLCSVENHLVEAYVIHADPPYATAVPVDMETIRRCWFFITDEGREYLCSLCRK